MILTAKPWQQIITNFLLEHNRCNIWSDMGSGKTAATLSAFDILQMCGSGYFPALVIAPLRVARDTWPAEQKKWDHLADMRISAIIGDPEDRRRALHKKADVYVTNYENIPWLIKYLDGKWPFKTVVADESTKLKAFRLPGGHQPSDKMLAEVKRKNYTRAQTLSLIARKTGRWINLTGTPAPNGFKDLWGQTWFLDFGERLGKTYSDFDSNYFEHAQWGYETKLRPGAQEQITKALSDITLTIDMKDWVDLKKPISHIVEVQLPPERMKEYRKLEREMFVTLQNDIELNATSAAARTIKCLQFAAGAAYHDEDLWTEIHTLKLEALEEIVEETAGANLLISFWWRHDAARIMKRFPHARLLKTEKDMADWNAGRISMGLAHPQSAGHGLNLQHGGHHIVFFSDFWNLETRMQIIERIGPMRQMQSGYNRPVYLHQIIAAGTLDEEVLLRHTSKADTQTLLMQAMKRRME